MTHTTNATIVGDVTDPESGRLVASNASAHGFKTPVQQNVVLEGAAKVKVDFKLDVGAISKRGEVQATASILQTPEASVGGTVSGTKLPGCP